MTFSYESKYENHSDSKNWICAMCKYSPELDPDGELEYFGHSHPYVVVDYNTLTNEAWSGGFYQSIETAITDYRFRLSDEIKKGGILNDLKGILKSDENEYDKDLDNF